MTRWILRRGGLCCLSFLPHSIKTRSRQRYCICGFSVANLPPDFIIMFLLSYRNLTPLYLKPQIRGWGGFSLPGSSFYKIKACNSLCSSSRLLCLFFNRHRVYVWSLSLQIDNMDSHVTAPGLAYDREEYSGDGHNPKKSDSAQRKPPISPRYWSPTTTTYFFDKNS